MNLQTTVRNFTGRTVNGLEVKAAVVDGEGKPVKQRTVVVIPTKQAELLPERHDAGGRAAGRNEGFGSPRRYQNGSNWIEVRRKDLTGLKKRCLLQPATQETNLPETASLAELKRARAFLSAAIASSTCCSSASSIRTPLAVALI